MRRAMVLVVAAVVLGGCGYAAEGPSPTSTTVYQYYDGEGQDALEAAQEERAQRELDEWHRQMAEDEGVDPSAEEPATSTTEPIWKQFGCKAPGDC